jgi:hypothetical protein
MVLLNFKGKPIGNINLYIMINGLIKIRMLLVWLAKNVTRFYSTKELFSKNALFLLFAVAVFQYQPFVEIPFVSPGTIYAQVETSPETMQFQLPHNGYLTNRYSRYHPGIDIAAPRRTPVKPITEGVVKEAGFNYYGLGLTVQVEHNNGYKSVYAHLGKIYVKVGQLVTKDDVLGEVGLTGNTTGPHTHLELIKDGAKIDPLTVVPHPTNNTTGDLPQVVTSVGGGLSQLPKTGISVLGIAILSAVPLGWRMRKIGNSATRSSLGKFVWESREQRK